MIEKDLWAKSRLWCKITVAMIKQVLFIHLELCSILSETYSVYGNEKRQDNRKRVLGALHLLHCILGQAKFRLAAQPTCITSNSRSSCAATASRILKHLWVVLQNNPIDVLTRCLTYDKSDRIFYGPLFLMMSERYLQEIDFRKLTSTSHNTNDVWKKTMFGSIKQARSMLMCIRLNS